MIIALNRINDGIVLKMWKNKMGGKFVFNCRFYKEGHMPIGAIQEALRLTEEEAFSILSLCLTSPEKLDETSERALKKLAEFCSSHGLADTSNHSIEPQETRRVS